MGEPNTENTTNADGVSSTSSVSSTNANTIATTSNHTENNENKYVSSELLLEHIQREYTKEDERARAFETKIPILLTLITLFLGFVVMADNTQIADKILKISPQLYFGYMLLQLASVVCLIISAGCLVYVICLREYRRLNITRFLDVKINNGSTGEIAYELIRGYHEALEHNLVENDKKAKTYTLGIKWLTVGVCCYIALSVVNSFF